MKLTTSPGMIYLKQCFYNFIKRATDVFIVVGLTNINMSRFASLSEEEIENIISDKDAKRTKKATEQSWSVLKSYCEEKQIDLNIHNITKQELNDLLKTFYVEARKADGNYYRKNSLTCLRHGINRKVKEVHDNWDIINDDEFKTSGIAYYAQCTGLKKMGLAKVTHYPPIDEEDLRKLYSCDVFNTDTPKNLQWKVFFELVLFLCRRGQENLRQLTKSCFVVKMGKKGEKYIEKVVDELTKNHRTDDEEEDGGIIVERNDSSCPVKSFEKYISKLNPKVDYLFQRPKRDTPKDGPWYDAQAVGNNTLEKFMTNISIDAKLSQKYTNHSIRATTITVLDGEGYESRHILTVTGHSSAESLRSYCRTSIGTKRKMSDALSNSIGKVDDNDPRLSSRNFNFGIDFNREAESYATRVADVDNASSVDYSINSLSGHRLPIVISNNTDCVINIKL